MSSSERIVGYWLLVIGYCEAGAPTWTCTTTPLLRTERCSTLTLWEPKQTRTAELGTRNSALPGRVVLSALRVSRFALEMVSVAGLAPARSGLKGWSLGLLCIHGQTMAAGVGLAPTPPVLQTGVQTLYTIQRGQMVVPRGNAPRSPAYQAGALLLSYRTLAEGVGNAPTSAHADPVFGTGAASLYLPAFQARSARIANRR